VIEKQWLIEQIGKLEGELVDAEAQRLITEQKCKDAQIQFDFAKDRVSSINICLKEWRWQLDNYNDLFLKEKVYE